MRSEHAARQKRDKKIVPAFLALAALCVLAITIAAARQTVRVDVESFKLGTIVRLSVWGRGQAQAAKLLDGALEEITRLESLYSVNIPGSDVARVNGSAGTAPVKVSGETYELAARALYWAGRTKGAFEPRIGPVVALWGIGTDHARVPSGAEIRDALRNVVGGKVLISSGLDGDYSLFLQQKGQRLDFGAIAKGQVADLVAAYLERNGARGALIDLGGNIAVIGEGPRDGKWKLGIQHPYKPRGEYFGVLEASDESVVTSGRYERFFERDGIRYHHIFDPATGRPSASDLDSVTVVLDRSADADALSTALFVMGLEKARAFLKENPQVGAILVTGGEAGTRVFVTKGVAPRFTLRDPAMTLEEVE